MYSYINGLWEVYKEARDLNNREDIIVTTPRRAGKTTLFRNLIAAYYDQGLNKHDILFIAPQKTYKILNIKPYTTKNSVMGIAPKIIIVEEAVYCKNEVLMQVEPCIRGSRNFIKAIYIGTPKKVKYTYNEGKEKWISDCWLKNLIDTGTIKYYKFTFEDYTSPSSVEYRDHILSERPYYDSEHWDTEIRGEWVEEYCAPEGHCFEPYAS